jgi:hypothetical protein
VFKIVHAEFIAPAIKRFVIEAPRIARKQKPGQFIILRLYEHGERIPLTIERSNPERGTINLVVQSAGKTTYLLNLLETGTASSTWSAARQALEIETGHRRSHGWRSRYGDGLSYRRSAQASR